MTDLAADTAGLRAARRPYVLATVVWRRAPTSGQVGAKAVVLPDGSVRGFIGGGGGRPAPGGAGVGGVAGGPAPAAVLRPPGGGAGGRRGGGGWGPPGLPEGGGRG